MPRVVDGVMFAHPERWSSQDDLTVDAQMYIKKASEVIHRTGDPHLKLRYRVRAHGRFENVTALTCTRCRCHTHVSKTHKASSWRHHSSTTSCLRHRLGATLLWDPFFACSLGAWCITGGGRG